MRTTTVRRSAARVATILATVLVAASCVSVSPENSPTAVPTASPSPTATPETPQPTIPPTERPTPTEFAPEDPPPPTPTPTPSPTPTPTPTPTLPPPTPSGPIDFTLPPQNGSKTFQPGSSADPLMVDLAVQGSIDASYLGDSCGGSVTSAPQVEIDFVGPSSTGLLRFYFDGSGDPTLVIHTSGGDWLCNDDSYGGSDPTVTIQDSTALQGSSQYLVWVGSYAGSSLIGTLYVTALDSNHP